MNADSNEPDSNWGDFDEKELQRWSERADEDGFLSKPLPEEFASGAANGPLQVGDSIDGYIITSQIASGGKATVYKAQQSRVAHRVVALKVYHRPLDAKMPALLQDEISTLSKLEHPNLASILDAGVTSDSRTYVVLPLLDGVELDQYCSSHALGPVQIAMLFEQISSAVHEVHQLGYVHCDIKPSNVLVNSYGVPTVTDFDAARLAGTLPDLVQGTIGYLAPEQIADRQGVMDARTDVYALGATLYKVLCDRSVFSGGSASGKLVATVFDEVKAPHMVNPSVPKDLSQICLRCLAKLPEDRYESAAEFADALHGFVGTANGNDTHRTRTLLSWGLGSLALASIGLIAFAIRGFPPAANESASRRTSINAELTVLREYRNSVDSLGPQKSSSGEARVDALATLARNFGERSAAEPENYSLAREYAITEWELSTYLRDIGKFEPAAAATRRAIEVYDHLLSVGYETQKIEFGLFHAYYSLAQIVENLGEVKVSREHRTTALNFIKQLHESAPGEPDYADCYAAQLIVHATSHESLRPDEWAEERYKRALALANGLRENPAARFRHWRHRTDASWCLARIYMNMENTDAALNCYEDAIRYANEMVEAAPDDWGYRCDRIVARHAASDAYHFAGEPEKARAFISQADEDISWLKDNRPDSIRVQEFEEEKNRILESWK